MINRNYRKKLDENGSPIMENGDFVMDIVLEVEVPDEVLPPDWNGLTQSLWSSDLMGFAAQNANPNGFSLLLKVLTDGEINSAAQQSFLTALSFCGLSLSTNQKQELNQMLTDNHFTIQV